MNVNLVMSDIDMKITEFTVSYSFDKYINGQKSNHFVSMKFSPSEPLSLDEIQIAQLQASKLVSTSVIHDAVVRGAISVNEGAEIIEFFNQSHTKLIDKMNSNKIEILK